MTRKHLSFAIALLLLAISCTLPVFSPANNNIQDYQKLSLVRIYYEARNTGNGNILNEVLADDLFVSIVDSGWGKNEEITASVGRKNKRYYKVHKIELSGLDGRVIADVTCYSLDTNQTHRATAQFEIVRNKIVKILLF